MKNNHEKHDCRHIEPELTAQEVTELQIAREEELASLGPRDSAGDLVGDPYDGSGWPGDDSGTDDLANLMAHGDEGCCDGPGDF